MTALAFERAYRRRATFDRRRGDERGWLFAIARNPSLDELRRRRRLTGLVADPHVDETPPDALEDGIEVTLRRALVRTAVVGLPARERELDLIPWSPRRSRHSRRSTPPSRATPATLRSPT